MLNAEPSEDARRVARSAARWWVRLESGAATEQDLAALARWRAANEAHETAWSRMQALKGQFQGVPPALAMASLDRPQQSRRRLLKGMLGVAAVAPAGWLALREAPIAAWRADYTTGTGERRRLTLADGSSLRLNTTTAVNIDPRLRRITLVRGEIGLRLAAAEPWSIITARGLARLDSGEACVRQDEACCQFSQYTGAMTLTPDGHAPLTLRAAQRVRLSDQGVGAVETFDARQADWRQGVIVALDQPLEAFLAELARYRSGFVRVAPELRGLRVTGSFRLDDPDQALDLLAASLPLSVNWRTRYWATLQPRKKTA